MSNVTLKLSAFRDLEQMYKNIQELQSSGKKVMIAGKELKTHRKYVWEYGESHVCMRGKLLGI